VVSSPITPISTRQVDGEGKQEHAAASDLILHRPRDGGPAGPIARQLRLPDGRPADYQPHQFARAGSNVGIHRADLLALLVEQLPPGTVRTGHCCTGFGQDAGQAVVSFANGASDTADVVIGGGRHPFGDAPLGGYLAGWAIESMAIVTASIRTGSWSGLISTP
jgi:hypothetical protein